MSELLNSLLVGFSTVTLLAAVILGAVSFVLWESPYKLKDLNDRGLNLVLLRVFLAAGFLMTLANYTGKMLV